MPRTKSTTISIAEQQIRAIIYLQFDLDMIQWTTTKDEINMYYTKNN